MRSVLAILATIVVCAVPLRGQSVPKAEVFVGYSYLNIDTNGLSSRQSANGWEASVSGNFNRWFAVEFDGSGYYKSYPVDLSSFGLGSISFKVTDYSYLAGPRINFGPLFVHGLVGGDHLTGSYEGTSESQDGLAGAFGGGAQWKIARNLYFRTSADYVLSRHNIFGGPSTTQNNFRASAGIVFAFGGERRERSTSNAIAPPESAVSSEAGPLGISGYSVRYGFKITSVRSGSPSAQSGLHAGDVIEKIDGQPVSTSQEIERAVAASKSGTIKVSYLLDGNWLTERVVKVR